MFSPGYPAGAEPCAGACHHAAAPQHHNHAHHAHAHSHTGAPKRYGPAGSPSPEPDRDPFADLGPDEYPGEQPEECCDGEFDPLLFIASLPAPPATPAARPFVLPPKARTGGRVTLVLDLDETLVHCSTDAAEIPTPDFTFGVVFNGVAYNVRARKRPGCDRFLQWAAPLFEVVVFTASQRVYADALLDILDPHRRYFSARLFRDSCTCVEGNFLKDLTVLGRNLATTCIVDNSPQAFAYQLDNGIPIVSWFDCDEDDALDRLMPFLAKVHAAEDVRTEIRGRFRLRDRVLDRYAAHRNRRG